MRPQLPIYRFIQYRSDGVILEENLSNFLLAYKLCEPENPAHWHVRVLGSLAADFAIPGSVVRISYNDHPDYDGLYRANYIQHCPNGINTPLPNIVNHTWQSAAAE